MAGAEDAPELVDRLPLVEVARAWGLSVSLYSFEDAPDRLGYFTAGRGITLGRENLSTWTHELHAADHRLGYLTKGGQDLAQETVAEFGGQSSWSVSVRRSKATAAAPTSTSNITPESTSAPPLTSAFS